MPHAHEEQIQHAAALIEALPYMQKYRGHLFVIKYGGSAMDDENAVERLLRDIVFLEAVGINPVLVHGGGKAITEKMRGAGLKARFVNGLRVTDEKTIQIVESVLDTQVNPRLVSTVNEFGGKAVGISGKRVFRAKKLPPQLDGKTEVDLGFAGEVVGVELDEIHRVVSQEIVPVISPVASGGEGEALNVNADIGAGSLAGALRASKLIYVSDVPGVMRNREQADSLIPSVSRETVNKLIADEIITGGMIPKVTSAVKAIDAGVGAVHFIDGRLPHSLLLEIFTTDGVGTEILA
jgi:acetylglutamate kinase